ncbi:MAG TPA: ATP-binding cassette domain-containing protein, partial [Pseudomonadales bacterium]|nr:ATP-binding cassette domain-containing protein [Pseudomonadales bacterium]
SRERDHLRNTTFGFIFQFFNLLPTLTAVENVALPLLLAGRSRGQAMPPARAELDRVGLSQRADHYPDEMSGGEMQRVAIARALVVEPEAVLMDEPTGNLDQATAGEIHALMDELNRDLGTSFVIVTHDPQLAGRMDRVLTLAQGRLHEGR